MVIVYDNFDLMKEPRDYASVAGIDVRSIEYTPSEYNFIVHTTIQETIEFTLFENGSVVKKGSILGNTFTSTGKTQLATLVGRTDGTPINKVICTVGGSDYTQDASNTTPGGGATLRVTSGTFTTAGTYTVVAGAAGSTKYNTISTNIVVGSGQSVQYVIDYVFSGPSPTFSAICAARLGNVTGSYNAYIGTIKVTSTDVTVYPTASTGVVTGNTLTIDTIAGFAYAKTFNIFAFYMSSVDTAVYVTPTNSMIIPVGASQTMNVRGVFVFG